MTQQRSLVFRPPKAEFAQYCTTLSVTAPWLVQFCGSLGHSTVVRRLRLCHLEDMRFRSLTAEFLRWCTYSSALLSSGCLGGQSGGETGNHARPDSPAPCACIPDGSRPVRARVTALQGGCAELEVLEVLAEPQANEYLPLRVGDVFGGVLQPMCAGGASIEEGNEVLALFERGAQTSSACPEYVACSQQRCGSPDDAYTTTIDPECEAEQQDNPAIDCRPIEHVDEAALIAYDQCDTGCLEENRDVCATHTGDEQLGGRVQVSRWVDGEIQFHWAGQQRQETVEQLQSPMCQQRLHQLWNERPRTTNRSGGDTAQAPPLAQDPPICPLKASP